ncbi:Uncharacterised protein [Streptococcus pneumoniae]|nr:Uncharacterised protein [Streptococcus pneumoniae]
MQDHTAISDHQNIVTKFLNIGHDMVRKDNGCSALFFLKNDLFEQFCINWVQSTKRLIQDNQVWFMNQSNNELNLLLISF